MRVAQVHIEAKPDCVEAFKQACAENAGQSRREPGVVRFDILQSTEQPTSFVLFEVYRSEEAQAAHKRTAHFAKWRADVENLIVEPGRAIMYSYVHPEKRDSA